MKQTYDVIIERENGHYRAPLVTLPNVAVEAATRDDALRKLRAEAVGYLQRVEFTTLELEVAADSLRPGSPQAVLNAMAASNLDTASEFYQEYLANLDSHKQQQRHCLRSQS